MHICSPSVPLFTYNPYSKQLMLLLVKKQDARFVHSRANHRFVLEYMTRVRARFPTQFMRKWIPDFSLLTGFINPQDYQG